MCLRTLSFQMMKQKNKCLVGSHLRSLLQCCRSHSICQKYRFPVSLVSFFMHAGHGEMIQRILDILRFLWAIVLAMVDGLTQWLNLLTKQYRDTSTVLCNERYFITHKIEQVFKTHKLFFSTKIHLWNQICDKQTHGTPINVCLAL